VTLCSFSRVQKPACGRFTGHTANRPQSQPAIQPTGHKANPLYSRLIGQCR